MFFKSKKDKKIEVLKDEINFTKSVLRMILSEVSNSISEKKSDNIDNNQFFKQINEAIEKTIIRFIARNQK